MINWSSLSDYQHSEENSLDSDEIVTADNYYVIKGHG